MVSQKVCVIQFQLKVQLNQIKVTQTNKYCFITFLGLLQYTVLSGLKPVLQYMCVICSRSMCLWETILASVKIIFLHNVFVMSSSISVHQKCDKNTETSC